MLTAAHSKQNRSPDHLGYRPDIDGLRAVAVIPVILFHAGFGPFKGGFVGVDVFFVISGFLITTILMREHAAGAFSLVGFYERRARRILPALCVVMVCCIPFAWLWMMADQLKQFAQSLAAVTLFSSNMLFWRSSGYFEPAAAEKPLLHTWSLGVEEQFYLFFPLFLMLTWKLGRRRLMALLLVIALGSLALSEWGWRTFPSANFFLAPTRAWELLIGSMLALSRSESTHRTTHSLQKELMSVAGLLAVGWSIVAFDELTPFPSIYALVPTLGTALLLAFAPGTAVGRLLSLEPLVAVGMVSYSAYLWHQPLFAFARIRSFNEPSPILFGCLAVATFGLAYLSWKFVETPFRDRRRFSRREVFGAASVACGTLVVVGSIGHLADGFRSYQYKRALRHGYLVFDVEAELARRKKLLDCSEASLSSPFEAERDRTRILVVGDSHANDVALAYLQNEPVFASQYQFRRIALDETCWNESDASASTHECIAARQKLFQSGLLDSADFILLVVRWSLGDVARVEPFKRAIGQKEDKLVLVGRTAEFFDVPSLLARVVKTDAADSNADLERMLARYRVTSIDAINDALRKEASRLGLQYLDKLKLICSDDRCSFLSQTNWPYFFDYGHWSLVGAKQFGANMMSMGWLPRKRPSREP